MDIKEKRRIRDRDKNRYGVIPVGYCMHHLWYSEEYNPESFVIITKEEHEAIHNMKHIDCSTGPDKKHIWKNIWKNIEKNIIKEKQTDTRKKENIF